MSAPEHHPLCFKDGCLGVDGGCCRAAYMLGDTARHAQNMADFERLRGHAKNDATMYRNTIEAQAIEIERLRKESAAHWSLARTNGEDAARVAAQIVELRRAANSVVEAWQVEPGDRFSADWHSEFRCLENALGPKCSAHSQIEQAATLLRAWQRQASPGHPLARGVQLALAALGKRETDPPRCPDCSGDLGGVELGRLEEHQRGCPRFPL